MALVAVKIIGGIAFDIYALEHDGKCDLLEFLADLEQTQPQELARLTKAFDRTAECGLIRNVEKFKMLRDKIFEFKTRGGVRVACFVDVGKLVILTNGFKKPKDYADEIERAIRLKNLYESSKRNDCLTYRDETD